MGVLSIFRDRNLFCNIPRREIRGMEPHSVIRSLEKCKKLQKFAKIYENQVLKGGYGVLDSY